MKKGKKIPKKKVSEYIIQKEKKKQMFCNLRSDGPIDPIFYNHTAKFHQIGQEFFDVIEIHTNTNTYQHKHIHAHVNDKSIIQA